MLKWFYKYNKILLVTLGSFLMVVFLLPGADIFQPDPAAMPVGEINGREITQGDLQRAGLEINLLKREFPPVPEAHPAHFPDDPLHWVLLVEEAARHGVYVSESEARLLVDNMDPQNKAAVLRAYGIGEEVLVRTYQHGLMWQRLLDMVMSPERPSEPRLRHHAQASRSRVGIEVVVVDPTKMLAQVPDPTPEQLQQHFQKYRTFDPGESEPYGFGYRLPDRVKLEYLTVMRDDVKAAITVDEVQAQRFYLDHPERYVPAPKPETPETPEGDAAAPAPAPDAPKSEAPKSDTPSGDAPKDDTSGAKGPTGAPGVELAQNDAERDTPAVPASPKDAAADETTEQPATGDAEQPAEPRKAPGPRPYKEVREQVIEDVRNAEADKKLDRIVKTIRAMLEENRRGLPTDDAGFYVLDSYTPPSFEKLAEQIQQEFGVLPKVTRIENRWLSARDLADEGRFGRAAIQFGGRFFPIGRYVFSLRELHDQAELDEHPLRQLRLQKSVASLPVVDDQNNEHIFRVFEISPAHAPEKIDEVTAQVEKDWRRLQTYEELIARVDTLVQRARAEGLKGIADSFETQVHTPPPFPKRDERAIQQAMRQRQLAMMLGMPELAAGVELSNVPMVQGVGRSEHFLDEVFNLASTVREAGGPEEAKPEAKIDAIKLDDQMRVALVKIVQDMPIDSQQYRGEKLAILSDMRMQQMRTMDPTKLDIKNNPLSKDALKKRLGYVEAFAEEDEQADGEPADAETDTTKS